MTKRLSPGLVLYGLIAILYSLMLIEIKPQDPAVFFLWLMSLWVVIVRLRFNLIARWYGLDLLAYAILLVCFDVALYLVVPSLVLFLSAGKTWPVGVFALSWFIVSPRTDSLLFFGVAGLLGGGVLFIWQRDVNAMRHEQDSLREKVYRLEQERALILKEQETLSRVSVLAERDRIAQKLHDDLGHQLTGALMALRAYVADRPDAQEHGSFAGLNNRLEGAVDSLKATVHATKPDEAVGLERFKTLIESFEAVPTKYAQSGDVSVLCVTHWHVLLGVLQESLTNVLKHADATQIDIDLTVTQQIIRLTVKNDRPRINRSKHGVGLIYMRRRLEALGGALNIQQDITFTVRALLPIELEVV
ncbi:MAG: hypothetical protein EA374_03795 [Acholeplasmatales bacterium]|nr:MAG: hypothetical protein EA374_03795 [Acholeplasmatales bacterium]